MNEASNDNNPALLKTDRLLDQVFLSFLATAGLFYVNIMPAIVNGLIEGLGFSVEQAGYVGSANVYGAAVGALTVVFLIHRLVWRSMAYSLLTLLILIDLLSLFFSDPVSLIGVRFFHGVVGGGLVGIGFSVIARTTQPDKTFGVLLVIQFGLGGLGNLYLPRLVPVFGIDVLFLSLVAFSLVTLAMIPFLSKYPITSMPVGLRKEGKKMKVTPLLLSLLAIFLFQAANMGLFAFIIGLGEKAGLSLEFITLTLAISGWVGIAGAVLVILLHTKYGRTLPLSIAIAFTALGFWALHFSGNSNLFFWANCAMGITWAFVIPYLFGLMAEFDSSGRMAALGGFASKMGLASGPLVAGVLIGGGENYTLLINLGIVVLIASLLAVLLPSSQQDKVMRIEIGSPDG